MKYYWLNGNLGFKGFVGELGNDWFTAFTIHADRRGKPPAATHSQLCGAGELQDLKAFWCQNFQWTHWRTFDDLTGTITIE